MNRKRPLSDVTRQIFFYLLFIIRQVGPKKYKKFKTGRCRITLTKWQAAVVMLTDLHPRQCGQRIIMPLHGPWDPASLHNQKTCPNLCTQKPEPKRWADLASSLCFSARQSGCHGNFLSCPSKCYLYLDQKTKPDTKGNRTNYCLQQKKATDSEVTRVSQAQYQ